MTEENYLAEGEKICLRLMRPDDTDRIVAWRNNPRVRERFIYRGVFSKEGHEAWIRNMVDTGKVVQFIICEKVTGRPVGSVYFRDIDKTHNKAEYGIFIGEDDAEGRGYGTEACSLACEYAFSVMGLHRIFLRAFSDNARAIASYEAGGFQREGLLRDDVFIDGRYRDIVLMGRIAPKRG